MSAADAVRGNLYDKYGTANPVARRLMSGFERDLAALLARAAPASILDVGCGEGVLTERWARADPARRVVGVDLEDRALRAEWARRAAPNLEFRAMPAEALAVGDGEFDLVAGIELLEHVAEPDRVLAGMTRAAASHVLVSVPREPLWRALNLARGAYLRRLGDTPGHVQHWSRRGFLALLEPHGDVVEARSPLPWTVVLLRVRRERTSPLP